ncbi:MAG TPA: hypothetical protein VJG32_03950 [Anaerolineae bacterium]|nr:hypothetical protein [Anaerolineae bacterium]
MLLLKRIFPVALTIGVGWLVLLSYLFPGLTVPFVGVTLTAVRAFLLEWAVILAAFALVLGVINLLGVHFWRFRSGQGAFFSLVLIASSGIVLGLWIGSVIDLLGQGNSLADAFRLSTVLNDAFENIVLPAQAALGALLAILIAVAGFRALRVRRSLGMVLFVLTAIVVALTQPIVPPLGEILRPIREGLIDPITTGGLRGLLLGVALGSVAFGLRLLVGADKPQGE